jgi:hypothetical protein
MEKLKIVTLDELKKQMRVDFEDEDDIISLYGVAAEDAIIYGTERTLDELNAIGYEEQEGKPAEGTEIGKGYFPKRLKLAILILAAHNYRNREPVAAVAQNPVPFSIEVYTKPYRKLSNRGENVC